MSDVTASNKTFSGLIGTLKILMFDTHQTFINFVDSVFLPHVIACYESV